ncbi:uncharacterized protein LOC113753726 [Coffea eugenioides]|uniref:uncharacterized protein LOC113753726 n=1 Tax=Coffea eugenioides TaxID=49369 RepID=UPI000F6092D8|nr:uncharacterized protein LOC113753726 [Coffea eugenioides]
MEDSFRVRVDRVFGSLVSSSPSNNRNSNHTPPSSSSLTSLWSLSDQEIERKEWKRDSPDCPPRSPSPPSNLHHPLLSSSSSFSPSTAALSLPPPHRQHLYPDRGNYDHQDHIRNNEEQEEDNPAGKGHQDHEDGQDWDIRSSIGLDCTLDFEDEEDEYDKVAVDREKAGDILCMGDVVDYGIEVNAHNELPSSFKDAPRDPRANHMAAKLRLREDAEAAGDFDTSKLSEMCMSSLTNRQGQQKVEDLVTPKPILRKRENPIHKKSPKRVRFHEQQQPNLGPNDSALGTCSPEEISSSEEALDLPGNQSLVVEAKASDVESSAPLKSSSSGESALLEDASSVPRVSNYIPDYLRNPTRYTRYDLASSYDTDEESNRKAYMEFLNQVNPAETHPDEASLTFQHPLTFTPKKKEHDLSMVKENGVKQNQVEVSKDKPIAVGIAAGDAYAQDNEVCAMEEDGFETVVCKNSQKPGRRYRSRTRTGMDSDDHVT